MSDYGTSPIMHALPGSRAFNALPIGSHERQVIVAHDWQLIVQDEQADISSSSPNTE